MKHPLQGKRPWPVDTTVELPVERSADSDPLIQRPLEVVERGEAIHNDASPPVREINPQSVPRPGVVGDPWRRGEDVPREE